MQSAEYNNAPSRKNNQQSQNNINFYDMNLKLRSLGSPPLPPCTHPPTQTPQSTPFSQNYLISSHPFNIRQDFTPNNRHLNLKQRLACYQNQNQVWETQMESIDSNESTT